MPDRIRLEREHILQTKRNEIEQAAIEIKISEMKHRLIQEPAPIIGDDQLGITLLDFFVIGDRIVAKREGDENDQCAEQYRCRRVVPVGTFEAFLNSAPQASRNPVTIIDTQLEKASRTCCQ